MPSCRPAKVQFVEPWWLEDFWAEHPDPTDAEFEAVARGYIAYSARTELTSVDMADPDYWAMLAVWEAPDADRVERGIQWRLIEKLCEVAKPEQKHALAMIGAGILEDYIGFGGEAALERVFAAAAQSPSMRVALSMVWSKPFRARIDDFLEAHR